MKASNDFVQPGRAIDLPPSSAAIGGFQDQRVRLAEITTSSREHKAYIQIKELYIEDHAHSVRQVDQGPGLAAIFLTGEVWRSRWPGRQHGYNSAQRCHPHLLLFCNAQRNRLKVLVWDGTGLWVCAKWLEKGRFTWPQSGDAQGKVVLSHEELSLLLGGIDLAQTKRKRWYRKSSADGQAA